MNDAPIDKDRELELYKAQLQADLARHKADLDSELHASQRKWEQDMATWRSQVESGLEHYRATNEFKIETNKAMFSGVVAFATLAIRTTVLINGAAALALLAFLGHVIGEKALAPDKAVLVVQAPMTDFAWGTLLAVVGAGFSYFAQTLFIEHQNDKGMTVKWSGGTCRAIAALSVCASVGFFMWGLEEAADAFRSFPSVSGL